MSDTRTIELSFTIPVDRDAVWAALTESDRLSRWFAPDCRVVPGPEGSIFVSWGPGMEAESKIRAWEPNEHLRIDFGENPQTKQLLSVDYHLEGKGGTTVLRLVHSGFSADAEWDEEFESHLRGWRLFLHNLRHDLVHHRGKACKQHVFSVDSTLGRDETWARVTGKAGLDRDGALAGKKTGERLELVTAGGDRLAGSVQVLGTARDLGMTLDDLGDALLRVSFERKSKGGTLVYCVLLAYGDDQARAEATAGRLRETLQAAVAG
jgi:uncharacterized protein YndB with AHSA1/START domain